MLYVVYNFLCKILKVKLIDNQKCKLLNSTYMCQVYWEWHSQISKRYDYNLKLF